MYNILEHNQQNSCFVQGRQSCLTV
uniref:Uncharacterized protein n=1 Tax=Anguilla anguilla TaxID=7936 RepID=A0A0E9QUK3_ANGAN